MATLLTHPPEAAETTKTLIELAGVEKVYRNGKLEYLALRGSICRSRPVSSWRSSARPGAASRRSST